MRLLVLALVAVVAAAVVGSAFACPRMQSVQKSYTVATLPPPSIAGR